MGTLSTFGLGFLLLSSLAGIASAASPSDVASDSLNRKYLRASMTRVSRTQKTIPDARTSAAYVVFGSGLMSLGLFFGHIRQRSSAK
jgi:hypothetical protein